MFDRFKRPRVFNNDQIRRSVSDSPRRHRTPRVQCRFNYDAYPNRLMRPGPATSKETLSVIHRLCANPLERHDSVCYNTCTVQPHYDSGRTRAYNFRRKRVLARHCYGCLFDDRIAKPHVCPHVVRRSFSRSTPLGRPKPSPGRVSSAANFDSIGCVKSLRVYAKRNRLSRISSRQSRTPYVCISVVFFFFAKTVVIVPYPIVEIESIRGNRITFVIERDLKYWRKRDM